MSVVTTSPGTKQLKEYVSQLEKAIEELNSVREHLQENAHQVKCEIHSTVSRELEALRNREVWLLTQVDLLQNVKEDILRGQQAQINKELGRAEKGLKYVQTDKNEMTEDIRTGLERLDLTDLAPEESSQISFQSDAAGLRDTIMEFGRIDGGNRIIQKVFADANTPSASLPKPFEDYDDAEHHVLYKTLEEVNRTNRSSSNIIVNIPKLNLKREQLMGASEPEKRPNKLKFPTLSNDISDWLLPSSKSNTHLTKDKSIQNWLHQIKHFPHTHDEEDEFEIVEHITISDTSESVVDVATSVTTPMQSASPAIQLINPGHFTQVTADTMTGWLKVAVSSPSSMTTDQDQEMFTGFKHLSNDVEFWLLRKSSCSGLCSPCLEPVEIENLGSLLCVPKATQFSQLPGDDEFWLMRPTVTSVPPVRMPPIENLCKANEPCQCAEECLSTPSCHVEYLMSTQGENIWLLKDPQNIKSVNLQTELFHHTDNYSDWLKKDQPSTCFPTNVLSSWFASVSDKSSDWLKTDQSMEVLQEDSEQPDQPMETANEEVICQPVSRDFEMWLLKRPVQRHTDLKDSNIFPAFDSFQKALPPSAWLVGCADNKLYTKSESDESEKKDISEKVELSKWLFNPNPMCSDAVTSFSRPGEWFFNKKLS